MHWGSKFKEKMLCYVALKPRICHKIKNLMILNVLSKWREDRE